MLTMLKLTNKANFLIFLSLSFLKGSSSKINWDSGCGSIKGCFPDCQDGCDFLVTWRDNSPNTEFTVQVEDSDDKYVAIGFSKDRRMGDDSVVGCIFPANAAYSYYNDGTKPSKLSNPTLGLAGISMSSADRVLACNVTRSYDETDNDFFNLKDDYILMLITGPAGDNTMKEHNRIPWMSKEKVDFNSHDIVGLFKLSTPLVKCHGIFMVLAWLLLVIVGVFTARHNRKAFPEVFGGDLWFLVHRVLMILACVFTFIGYIMIIVEIEGISQILQKNRFAHPVIGIITTALCIANPIMGLLRCNPEHHLRKVFDIAHRIVAISAMILACINIFIGYTLERAELPNSPIVITGVALGITAVVSIGLEINKCINRNGSSFLTGWKFHVIVTATIAAVLFIFAIAILGIIAAS